MILDALWGHGEDLSATQMSMRSLVTFVIALVLIRIAGRRAFGQKTAFDACVAVLLGSVLSRAVVGASPYLSTVAACLVMAIAHRTLAFVSLQSASFDSLMNGKVRLLFHDGRKDVAEMRAGLISDTDLQEAIRKHTQSEDLSKIACAVLEQSGEITVVKKE